MVAAGLPLLPAILAALGRRARPAPAEPSRVWGAVGRLVASRPAPVAAAVTALLLAGALAALGGREPLDFAEAFRDPPESVEGQQLVRDRFIPGRAAPTSVVTEAAAVETVIADLTRGREAPVQEMHLTTRSARGRPELALAEAYLRADPFSDAATGAIPGIRETARAAAGGATVLVGGETAEAYDTREALAGDTRLIAPVSLALILLILAVLLRALVMPLYVVATVILSFGFALGAGSLLFTHVLGQPASDPSLALFAFIFLVALGVDYNVFLLARIREERRRGSATREAVTAALERTGGVITRDRKSVV
jgi:RND superfamily putative drug exporter